MSSKFVVGVIGTQNTGKSTFIGDIINTFKGTLNEFHTVGCDYREKIRKSGLQINRNGNLEAQRIILDTLVEQLDIIQKMPDGNYITDRSPIDAYVYTVYLFRHNPELGITQDDLDEMFNKVKKSIAGYDRIIYIDLDNCCNVEVVDDTLRDTNLEYRAEIDQLFKETFKKLGNALDGKLNPEIKGTREMRVNQFLEMEGGRFSLAREMRFEMETKRHPDPPQKVDVIYEDGYRVTDKYVLFYGSFLSNFAKCKFTWEYMGESHEFFCTEQAFMWAKAKFFGDSATAKRILDVIGDPMECKKLGRLVKNYDDEKWSEARYNIMRDVNFAKYSQYEPFRSRILNPEFDGKTFVEASPSDGIWGIRMCIAEKGVLDERNWNGQNLLGKAITEVREKLKALQSSPDVV